MRSFWFYNNIKYGIKQVLFRFQKLTTQMNIKQNPPIPPLFKGDTGGLHACNVY